MAARAAASKGPASTRIAAQDRDLHAWIAAAAKAFSHIQKKTHACQLKHDFTQAGRYACK